MTSASTPFDGLISICIPTYRRTAYLEVCLESCRAQADPNLEIIVHDDTPDNSIESIVQRFADLPIRYIRNDPPLGLVGKLNNFLEIAQGAWAVALCDDDLFEPGFIAAIRAQAGRHPQAAVIRCRNRIVDEKGKLLRLDPPGPEVSDTVQFLTQLFLSKDKTFTVNLTGFAFPPALLRKVGGFAECYKSYLTDRFALTRLAGVGVAICEPTPLCSIRKHSGSITSGVDADYQLSIASVHQLEAEAKEIFDRLERSAELSDTERRELLDARATLSEFVVRNLNRSYDRSLMALISRPGETAVQEARKIMAVMAESGAENFRSLRMYRLLFYFPEFLRLSVASAFLRLKNQKHR